MGPKIRLRISPFHLHDTRGGREGGREDPFFTPRSPFFPPRDLTVSRHFLLSHHRSATIDYCRICIQDAVCSTTSDSSHLPLLDILFLTLKMMKISRRETSNQLIFGDSFLRKIRKITFFQRQRLFGLIIFERKIGREDVYDYIPWCYLIPKINPFVHGEKIWRMNTILEKNQVCDSVFYSTNFS